jgi:hypothetical protein
MGKGFWRMSLFALVLAGSSLAFANSFFDRTPQFDLPKGAIAFMGCYWSPLSILGAGENPSSSAPNYTTVLQSSSGNVKVGVDTGMFVDMFMVEKPPTPVEATLEINQAVIEKSAQLGMSLTPVEYNTAYQNALLMHVLNPAKWKYNPQITKYCGLRPYILIGIIDYCDAFPSPVMIREKLNDQKISYWGKRSVLEKDSDIFASQGLQHAVALEFFLVSTADGSVVWQGNTMTSGNKNSGFKGIANGLVENALKNLMRK